MPKTKRKDRPRYPCGKLVPELAPPALVRRTLDQALRGAGDPLLGSRLGRFRLDNVIDDVQLAAGKTLGELVDAYCDAKGLPRRTIASPSYEIGRGHGVEDRQYDEQIIAALEASRGDRAALAKSDPEVERVLRLERRYLDALDHLTPASRSAVIDVVVYDDRLPYARRSDLVSGLEMLAQHWRLTTRGLTKRKR